MPEFICMRDCHVGKRWIAGEIYKGAKAPSKHFEPLTEGSVLRKHIDPANMTEMRVAGMRPDECRRYIKKRHGIDLDITKKDYAQEALFIMRNSPHKEGNLVPEILKGEEKPQIAEALTKKQYADKIKEENPGVEIPPAAMRSMKALKEFEANIGKEDFLS